MKLQKLISRLQQKHHRKLDLSLGRTFNLLNKLGNPQDRLNNVISIVGTNSKYSICQSLKAILNQSGYKCNLYLSPHLQTYTERFVYNDEEISDENLAKLLTEVEEINNGEPITYFEILTAAYFYYAKNFIYNINLVESGLFHRFDATNIINNNLASIVTSIGLDHLDWLPKNEQTLEKIIFEKTSKLLNSKIIVSEQSNNLIMEKIKKSLENNSSQKYFFDDFFSYKMNDEGFLYKDKFGSLQLSRPSLLGDHQISNAATAIATIRNLEDYYKIKKENLEKKK